MIENGTIIKKINEFIYEIQIFSEGENCLACSLSKKCDLKNSLILATSQKKREIGEKVRIDISEKEESLRVIIVFVLPIIMGILGVFLSYLIIFPKKALFAFISFTIFFAISIIFAHFIDKNSKNLPPILDQSNF